MAPSSSDLADTDAEPTATSVWLTRRTVIDRAVFPVMKPF